MSINLILAAGKDNSVGQSSTPNGLPWNNPEDMAFFKRKTEGNIVVMGGNTFRELQKIGFENGLPNRTNYVLTGDSTLIREGAYRLARLGGIWDMEKYHLFTCPDPVYIIGGVSIYDNLNKYADTAYITRIDRNYPEADVHIDLSWLNEFELVDTEVLNGYSYVEVYKRKN